MSNSSNALLMVSHITKEFPGVKALDGVNFDVVPGEIHAICGENGAGKSTLMKILAGLYPHGSYSGDIVFQGKKAVFRHIKDSRKSGIAIVFQELSLIKELSVAENIYLGSEQASFGVINWDRVYRDANQLMERLGFNVDTRAKVKDLGIGQQQLVEIAKAMSHDAKVLILDEPTSALAESEVDTLLQLMQRLKQQGTSCVMISHKLREVFSVADRITIFRDGKSITTYRATDTNEDAVIAAMVGREVKTLYPKTERKLGKIALEVKNLTVDHPERVGKKLLDDISLHVREGEILGIAGLMGAGRSELLLQIFGSGQPQRSGTIAVCGKEVHLKTPHDAIEAGLALVTEDRKRLGLLLEDSVMRNISLAALSRLARQGIVDQEVEAKNAKKFVAELRIKTPSITTPVKNLSGGNQQKVVLAKWILTQPKVLFLDEPTRGIDVGARAEIYRVIHELAAQGLAIVMVSSELPEVIGLSDRILVMSEGRMTGSFSSAEATQEKIMAKATLFH